MIHSVPVLKPELPNLSELSYRIESIDKTHWYTNNGPLVKELEDRLSFRYDGEGHFVTINNATSALALVLQSLNLPSGSRCLVPSWTFAASPLSILSAGLEPYFIDVDLITQTPAIEQIREAVSDPQNNIRALIVVYPFGEPIDHIYWENLAAELNLKLVFDAAAAFDQWTPTNVPSVISLHATKILPAAEGAVVFSKKKELIQELRSRANFGFSSSDRTASYAGTNAKLSEYHAAIALCSLDRYNAKRESLRKVAFQYKQRLNTTKFELPQGFGTWLATTMNVKLPSSYDIDDVESYLSRHGIQTKRWWTPCHLMTIFQRSPRSKSFHSTHLLSRQMIGLPFGSHHSIADHVDIVCSQLLKYKR